MFSFGPKTHYYDGCNDIYDGNFNDKNYQKAYKYKDFWVKNFMKWLKEFFFAKGIPLYKYF